MNHLEASIARRNQVLELVRLHRGATLLNGELLAVTDEEIDAAKAEEAVLQPPGISLRAPHFIFTQVKPQIEAMFGKEGLYEQGLSVQTSIDINLQDQSQVAMEKWITEFENISNSRNGAAIIVSPWTGEIWSYVGSRDYAREDIQGRNDNLVSLNSPGSSFKPFIYLTAFMNIGWGPGTVIVDEPTRFRESDGTVFQPSNPNGKYNGRISLRDSLGNSLNIPAFKTAQAVGVPTIVATAKNMGFTTLNSTYGPSIAIGGVDLTAMDLAYGYSILASGGLARGSAPILEGGREVEPIAILSVSDNQGNVIYNVEDHRREKRIIDPEYAFMVSSILSDPRAQCITFGCGGIQVPGRQVAVKTGTSEPYDPKSPDKGKIGETWAFGYTPDMVVGVWAGNSDNSPITNIYSTSISYRAMRDMLLNAYGNWQGNTFVQPQSIVESTSCGTANGAIGCRRDLVRRSDEQRNRPSAVIDAREPGAEGREEPREANTAPAAPGSGSTGGGGGGAISAAITSPSGSVSGTVTIRGTATAPRMAGYTLQFRGPDGAWRTIGSWSVAVANGTLGAWSTAGLPPGSYAIRLVVRDASGATDESVVSVSIGGGGAAPGPTSPP
jgi:membrane peptidoglycan carboxypeptidase